MLTSKKILFVTFHSSLVTTNLHLFKLEFINKVHNVHTKLEILIVILNTFQHLRNIV